MGLNQSTITYNSSEILKHHKEDDAWVVCKEKIYDITSILDNFDNITKKFIIKNYLGKDITKFYRSIISFQKSMYNLYPLASLSIDEKMVIISSDETNPDETNPDETNQDETNQDETNQDESDTINSEFESKVKYKEMIDPPKSSTYPEVSHIGCQTDFNEKINTHIAIKYIEKPVLSHPVYKFDAFSFIIGNLVAGIIIHGFHRRSM